MKVKVCHLTSAHESTDTRIFVKECVSLAVAGYEVYLVAKGESREDKGVHIVGLGKAPNSRKERMARFTKKAYEKACELDCDIYHFHDPELLHYGLKLKKKGKIVVFDSHENVPGQILGKTYIPVPLRKIVAIIYKAYESYCVGRFDAVITATPYIAEQFSGRAKKVMAICNYPRLDDVLYHNSPFKNRKAQVCYAGGIEENRGEGIMTEVMKEVNGNLVLAGNHEKYVKGNISYVGLLDRTEVNALYGSSVVGLCLLKPIKNYIDSLPIKMFEYMAAGLPYVCSDFPLWKEIIDKYHCGICVNLDSVKEIRDAINYLFEHLEEAEQMGRNGRKAVEEEYNWKSQEKVLLKLYKGVVGVVL